MTELDAGHGKRIAGFTILEVLVASAVTLGFVGAMLQIARNAHDVSRAVPDMADAQQALRVAAETLRHDLFMAGAGGDGPLVSDLPPIRPANVSTDGELSFADDRITIRYVGNTTARARPVLSTVTSDPLIYLRGGWQCTRDPACGFATGMRVLVRATAAAPAPYDVFTVASTGEGWLSRDPLGDALSNTYAADGAVLTEVIERVYFLDRSDPADVKLMRAEPGQSPFPVLNRVTTLQFRYFAPEGELTGAMLTDGPILGTPPDQFDADLLRIRRVQVRLRVAGGQLGSTTGSQFEMPFDVSPPNMGAGR